MENPLFFLPKTMVLVFVFPPGRGFLRHPGLQSPSGPTSVLDVQRQPAGGRVFCWFCFCFCFGFCCFFFFLGIFLGVFWYVSMSFLLLRLTIIILVVDVFSFWADVVCWRFCFFFARVH